MDFAYIYYDVSVYLCGACEREERSQKERQRIYI